MPPPAPYSQDMERETGIEPATNSLEGCDSTTELLPPAASKLEYRNSKFVSQPTPLWRVSIFEFHFSISWWTGEDSNLRRPQGPAGLQPAAFDRSATCPPWRCQCQDGVCCAPHNFQSYSQLFTLEHSS